MSNLTHEQRSELLQAINLIKEKRCELIKGCTIAEGRGQREKDVKEDIMSLMVSKDTLKRICDSNTSNLKLQLLFASSDRVTFLKKVMFSILNILASIFII